MCVSGYAQMHVSHFQPSNSLHYMYVYSNSYRYILYIYMDARLSQYVIFIAADKK